MLKPDIIEKVPIPVAEVKGILKDLQKQQDELNYRANRVLDYANQATTLTPKQAKDLAKKITDLEIPRFKAEYVIKVIDLMPGSVGELKVILQGYPLSVSNENLQKIFEVISGFLPKK